METSPCCNSVTGDQIATNFCTCHDSTAVVPCTKFCSDHCIGIEMRAKRNFHRIWIAMEKPLVKRGPVTQAPNALQSDTNPTDLYWQSSSYQRVRSVQQIIPNLTLWSAWATLEETPRIYCLWQRIYPWITLILYRISIYYSNSISISYSIS